jgi:hypothetical protein
MAKLSMAQRKALPKSAFAVPSKAPGPGSYPIPDKKHAGVAKGLAGMHHSPSKGAVDKKANKVLGHSKHGSGFAGVFGK